MTQRPTAMKVVVIEPKVFEDSENITHQLLRHASCID